MPPDCSLAMTKAPDGWAIATLRWLWGADDDVGWRELFASTPTSWVLLLIFSAVSISDMVLAGSLNVSGPVIERLGQAPALMGKGEWWRFFTTTLVNAPEPDPPINALQHLAGNAVPFVIAAPRAELAVGSIKAVVLFIAASVCGAVALYAGTPFYWVPGGGTSNAVYGFIGGALVIGFLRRRRSTRDAVFFGAALVAVVSLAATATAFPAGTNVSHLGGFIAGSILALVWCSRPAARRAGFAVVVALFVIAGSVASARTVDIRRSDLAVVGETKLGFAPVMVTSGFESIWVTGGRAKGFAERDQVVRVDVRTGAITARIREPGIGGLPVVTRDRVWVAADDTLVAIDPRTNRIASRIRLSDGAWPWSVAATKDALWAADERSGEVIRVDLRSGEQQHIAVGARCFTVIAHGSNVWATSYEGQSVVRIDPDNGDVLARKRLPERLYHAVLIDGSLWVGGQPFVHRLDPESLEVLGKVDTRADVWTLAVDGGGNLLVPQRYARAVIQVGAGADRIERRIELGLRQPTAAVVVNGTYWIADTYRASVVRTDVPEED